MKAKKRGKNSIIHVKEISTFGKYKVLTGSDLENSIDFKCGQYSFNQPGSILPTEGTLHWLTLQLHWHYSGIDTSVSLTLQHSVSFPRCIRFQKAARSSLVTFTYLSLSTSCSVFFHYFLQTGFTTVSCLLLWPKYITVFALILFTCSLFISSLSSTFLFDYFCFHQILSFIQCVQVFTASLHLSSYLFSRYGSLTLIYNI